MFVKRITVSLTFVLAAVLLGVKPAAAAKTTPFEIDVATEVYKYVDWGDATTSGGNVHFHGPTFVVEFQSSDPRFEGLVTMVDRNWLMKVANPTPFGGPADGNWWVDVYDPTSGQPDGQLEWIGTKHIMPQITPTDPWVIEYEAQGQGIYAGLKVKMVDYSDPATGIETIRGEIFDPAGR